MNKYKLILLTSFLLISASLTTTAFASGNDCNCGSASLGMRGQ